MTTERKRRWFGTDGIRSQVGRKGTLTAELGLRVGLATGVMFRRAEVQLGNNGRQKVVIGKDTRLSSYMLENALTAGFLEAGMDVIQTGPVPTPGLAMLVRSMRADLGVMITASHNPYGDNGIKLFGPDGFKLSDDKELEIEALMESEELNDMRAEPQDMGRAKRIAGLEGRYNEFAKRTIPSGLEFDGLRVVIDGANGAGYFVSPLVLEELGAEVFAIGVEPDGFNINSECGSTAPKALCEKVLEVRADLGIALDGDADRVLIVDEKGKVVDGDQLLALIAENWQKDGLLKNSCVVGTVLSNLAFELHLKKLGITFERTQVGDRYVLERMRETGCNLGGEQSGHIIMSDHTTSGDGLIAALQVLAVIKHEGQPASKVCHRFEPVPQYAKNVEFRGMDPLQNVQVQECVRGVEESLGRSGRLVVRKSGTEPVVRIMVESHNKIQAEEAIDLITAALTAGG